MKSIINFILREGDFKLNSETGLISAISFSGLIITLLLALITTIGWHLELVLLNILSFFWLLGVFVLNYKDKLLLAKTMIFLLIPTTSLIYVYFIGYLGSENYLFIGAVAAAYFFRSKPIYGSLLVFVCAVSFVLSKYVLRVYKGAISIEDFQFGISILNSLWIFAVIYILAKMLQKFQERELSNVHEKNMLGTRLLSILTHDLMSPISNLQTITTYKDQSLFTTDDRIRVIQDVSERLSKVGPSIQNTLLWINKQTNGIQVNQTRINIFELTDEVCQSFYHELEKKQVELKVICEPDLYVVSDPDLYRIILRNLVANAIKFSPEIIGRVEVRITEKFTSYEVKVSDNGMGINKDQMDDLFDVGKTTLGSSNEKGHGLGLAITKELLDLLNEEIAVKSIPNECTCFRFTLSK